MFSIKVSDLQIVQEEVDRKISADSGTAKVIAGLLVENKKKDIMVTQLSQTIAGLNIEIQKLKGVVPNA